MDLALLVFNKITLKEGIIRIMRHTNDLYFVDRLYGKSALYIAYPYKKKKKVLKYKIYKPLCGMKKETKKFGEKIFKKLGYR